MPKQHGESPGLHPFVIADSLAASTVDMLRAAREFADSLGVDLNGQLFLAGYSEGGYATMAAHRAIETQHSEEFAVTASTPMAGPYDMSGVMSDLFTSEAPVNSPYYLPYTILAYQEYFQVADDLSVVLTPELAALIPGLFDGTHDSGEINSMIPDRPADFFQPEFLQDYLEDPDHPFRAILRENDVYRWNPQAPMRLYHCAGDELIPFETSQIAFDYFESEGKTDVELIDPDPDAGHGECAIESLLGAKAWFESLRE